MRVSTSVTVVVCLTVGSACTRYEAKPDYPYPEACRSTRSPARTELEISNVGGGIRGRVLVHLREKLPVADARVSLAHTPPALATTDAQGFFAIDSVPPGRYVLQVLAIGYDRWRDMVTVVTDERPPFDVLLTVNALDGPCSGFSDVYVKKPWWKFW